MPLLLAASAARGAVRGSRARRRGRWLPPPEPAIARPPSGKDRPVRGHRAERCDPPGRGMRREPLHPLEHAIGASIPLDEPSIRQKTSFERECAVEDGLDDPATLTAEIERGPNALRRQRQALPRG